MPLPSSCIRDLLVCRRAYASRQALASLAKLQRYEIETVARYHGGPCTGDVSTRITELARGPSGL
jgi:hypothetical protein